LAFGKISSSIVTVSFVFMTSSVYVIYDIKWGQKAGLALITLLVAYTSIFDGLGSVTVLAMCHDILLSVEEDYNRYLSIGIYSHSV